MNIIDVYKNQDFVDVYRQYYIHDKKDLLDYTNRKRPDWLGDK